MNTDSTQTKSTFRKFIEALRDVKLRAERVEQSGSYDFTNIKRDIDIAENNIHWSVSRRQAAIDRANEALSFFENATGLERVG